MDTNDQRKKSISNKSFVMKCLALFGQGYMALLQSPAFNIYECLHLIQLLNTANILWQHTSFCTSQNILNMCMIIIQISSGLYKMQIMLLINSSGTKFWD